MGFWRRQPEKRTLAALDQRPFVSFNSRSLVLRNGRKTASSEPPRAQIRYQMSSRGWTRTNNPPVNSRMLCQLSYAGRPRAL
jgi:hypothetical protein